MKNILSKICCNKDLALVLIRIALGSVFIVHGAQKLMALGATVNGFSMMGVPAILTYLVVAIELIGGIMVLLGVYARIAGVLIACVMIGAVILVKWNMGFLGGWEFDLVLFLNALAIAIVGSGSYSVCKKDVCLCSCMSAENKETPSSVGSSSVSGM